MIIIRLDRVLADRKMPWLPKLVYPTSISLT